ncbi:uncharacterized protein CcaverHIS019_0100310 [Cutaneotrichosporon cavernicola]|uniref:DUF1640-domain-containing protein n=1 Tax=Cutaneotrichosporon cavernicola TaxID=279322 RepID=A0AA48ICU6_9TREE|nr:uncharacterized protein CcaverHIS019_0100310 [Cutaneotrichosporon cavernicola]BEI87313.1 hypothetical protein CcaverHIS019_0100310 [Cutaneotrichosporon cavernicola]BEI95083.1 hypothetical protein CcaverHIS631_0100320 [Cutaneotrichosporon cavernicola]BEJ02857.1 hypothetical protein CcaverHIS641_0100320 [Cutaneotrichosporon cavernicola]
MHRLGLLYQLSRRGPGDLSLSQIYLQNNPSTHNGGTDIGRDFVPEPSDEIQIEPEPEPEPESKRADDWRRVRTGPSSAPLDELDSSATAVARVPLPEPLVVTPKRVRQPFDTHRFVSKLNAASIEPDVSRVLMESVRSLITHRVDRASENMLSKAELDDQAYLFRAALSRVRTEWNVRKRNAGIAGRDALSAIRRDIDSVELTMSEDVQELKHDIELEMGNRKTDTRSDMKQASINIEEINNRATISIGDLKTEIESAKWEATRRAIAIIAVFVVFGVVISTVTFGESKVPPGPKPDATAHPASASTPVTATRDMGIGTDDDFDYEARIDKLLEDVERPERPEPKRPRRSSKPDRFTYTERI